MKAASRRKRTTIGKARPSRALAVKVSEAPASIPRYGRTLGQRRTSRPGAGTRRIALAVVVSACGSCKHPLGVIEDEHSGRTVTERQGPVYAHGDEQQRKIEQTVAIHLPRKRRRRMLPPQPDAVPEQSGPQK